MLAAATTAAVSDRVEFTRRSITDLVQQGEVEEAGYGSGGCDDDDADAQGLRRVQGRVVR